MTTYYRVRQPVSKFVVHPHYVTDADVSNEAIVHQVSIFFFNSLATKNLQSSRRLCQEKKSYINLYEVKLWLSQH